MRIFSTLKGVWSKAKRMLFSSSPQIPLPAISAFDCATEDTKSRTAINLKEFPFGTEFLVETAGHKYLINKISDEKYLISGHPEYCPNPTEVSISGSTWVPNGSTLWTDRIGWGMHLEVYFSGGMRICTSAVEAVQIKEPKL